MSAARTLPFRGTRFGSPGSGSLSHGKPAAAYPGRVATNSDLIVAVDQQQTTLLLPVGVSDLTITVLDPSSIAAYNLLSIDSEIVKTIGPPAGNVIPVARGFDGTLPAAHVSGAIVAGFIDAYHHNALVAEVEAIETFLGPNGINLPSGSIQQGPIPFTPQAPGGNLVVGNNTITLTPVPKGVNGTDTNHWLWVSGGTGTAEAVLITGGSGTAGQPSGQIIIQCANTHSGAWTIQTATAGIQEAVVAAGTGRIYLPAGTYNTHAPVTIAAAFEIEGASRGSVYVQSNSPTQNIFYVNTPAAVHITAMTFYIAVARTAGSAIVLDGGTTGAEIDDITFIGQYINVSIASAAAVSIHDTYSAGTVLSGLVIANASADTGDSTFYANTWDGSNATGPGIAWSSGGGLRIINNKLLAFSYAIDINAGNNVATSDFLISLNSFESGLTGSNGAIRVRATGTNVQLLNVQITDNQIIVTGPCIQILTPAQQIIIAGNLLQSVGANQTCIIISAALTQIHNNRIGSGYPGSVGIDTTGIPGGATGAWAIENTMLNVVTPYSVTALTVIVDHSNALTFAQLPLNAGNGSSIYCSNGTAANPVAGGGTGCIAKKLNTIWVGN